MAVFLLLVVIIALPSISVLWFMTHAMENERLVVRQKLSEAYQSDLDVMDLRLQEYWDNRRKEIDDLSTGQPPAALFREVVTAGLCDSVLVLNTTGEMAYPVSATRKPILPATEELPLGGLASLPGSATSDPPDPADPRGKDWVALTLRNQAVRLLKAGDKEGALRILSERLQAPELLQAVDFSGRLICPDALLLALRNHNKPDPGFSTLEQIKRLLNDYSLPYFPSRQRLFLMGEVMNLEAGAEFPTYQAELLAQGYLESATVSGLWWLDSRESPFAPGEKGVGGMRFLFKPERILSESRQVIGEPALGKAYEVSLESQTETSTRPEPFLSVDAPEPLPGYRLALRLTGTDPFKQASQSQIMAYALAGGGVILVTLIVAVWIAYLLSNQIKLTRLRNDLIATVAHELRTPLASVRLLVDTLLDGRVSGEEATREYLGMISKESRRLSGLIDNFLTFSRMERNKIAFELETLDPRELIGSALASLSERFSRPGVHLTVEVDSGLSPLLGDRDALVTLLVNLLDNAYKYTGGEKTIALSASQVGEDLVFEVVDNGIGIPRRALKKIFKHFYQVDRSLSREAGGCGLGLSIVDFIVRGHHGQIRVESEVGKGSRFIITLPALPMGKDNGRQDSGC